MLLLLSTVPSQEQPLQQSTMLYTPTLFLSGGKVEALNHWSSLCGLDPQHSMSPGIRMNNTIWKLQINNKMLFVFLGPSMLYFENLQISPSRLVHSNSTLFYFWFSSFNLCSRQLLCTTRQLLPFLMATILSLFGGNHLLPTLIRCYRENWLLLGSRRWIYVSGLTFFPSGHHDQFKNGTWTIVRLTGATETQWWGHCLS